MKLLVLVTNARHCQGHFHLWGLSLPHSCVIADVTSMSLVSPKTHIVKLWNCSMQKAVSSAICMKWPLHRRRWDRSHRWTKSFDLERLWRMSTTTTLIYKISCNTMQRRFKSCSITIHVMIPPFSISAMWFNDSRSEWRLAPFGVSLSASLHGLHCGYTVATLWLHCYTATHLVQVSTALQGESVCACVRVPGALQNSSVPPQAARVTLVKRFHSFHVMKISAFQNLTKMCKYQCEILMNGHLFDMLFLSVEVFRQASCNVANLRSGAESAELATHWQCLSCVSCASYNALFACVHVLSSHATKSSQANSECNFKACSILRLQHCIHLDVKNSPSQGASVRLVESWPTKSAMQASSAQRRQCHSRSPK